MRCFLGHQICSLRYRELIWKIVRPTWHKRITSYVHQWLVYRGYAHRDQSRRQGKLAVLITPPLLFVLPLYCEAINQALLTVIIHCSGLSRLFGQVGGCKALMGPPNLICDWGWAVTCGSCCLDWSRWTCSSTCRAVKFQNEKTQ